MPLLNDKDGPLPLQRPHTRVTRRNFLQFLISSIAFNLIFLPSIKKEWLQGLTSFKTENEDKTQSSSTILKLQSLEALLHPTEYRSDQTLNMEHIGPFSFNFSTTFPASDITRYIQSYVLKKISDQIPQSGSVLVLFTAQYQDLNTKPNLEQSVFSSTPPIQQELASLTFSNSDLRLFMISTKGQPPHIFDPQTLLSSDKKVDWVEVLNGGVIKINYYQEPTTDNLDTIFGTEYFVFDNKNQGFLRLDIDNNIDSGQSPQGYHRRQPDNINYTSQPTKRNNGRTYLLDTGDNQLIELLIPRNSTLSPTATIVQQPPNPISLPNYDPKIKITTQPFFGPIEPKPLIFSHGDILGFFQTRNSNIQTEQGPYSNSLFFTIKFGSTLQTLYLNAQRKHLLPFLYETENRDWFLKTTNNQNIMKQVKIDLLPNFIFIGLIYMQSEDQKIMPWITITLNIRTGSIRLEENLDAANTINAFKIPDPTKKSEGNLDHSLSPQQT